MLTDADLLAWYRNLVLTESARAVVDHIRSPDPARRVGGGRRIIRGFYPSKNIALTWT
jgi:putative transposase